MRDYLAFIGLGVLLVGSALMVGVNALPSGSDPQMETARTETSFSVDVEDVESASEGSTFTNVSLRSQDNEKPVDAKAKTNSETKAEANAEKKVTKQTKGDEKSSEAKTHKEGEGESDSTHQESDESKSPDEAGHDEAEHNETNSDQAENHQSEGEDEKDKPHEQDGDKEVADEATAERISVYESHTGVNQPHSDSVLAEASFDEMFGDAPLSPAELLDAPAEQLASIINSSTGPTPSELHGTWELTPCHRDGKVVTQRTFDSNGLQFGQGAYYETVQFDAGENQNMSGPNTATTLFVKYDEEHMLAVVNQGTGYASYSLLKKISSEVLQASETFVEAEFEEMTGEGDSVLQKDEAKEEGPKDAKEETSMEEPEDEDPFDDPQDSPSDQKPADTEAAKSKDKTEPKVEAKSKVEKKEKAGAQG